MIEWIEWYLNAMNRSLIVVLFQAQNKIQSKFWSEISMESAFFCQQILIWNSHALDICKRFLSAIQRAKILNNQEILKFPPSEKKTVWMLEIAFRLPYQNENIFVFSHGISSSETRMNISNPEAHSWNRHCLP